MITVDKLRYTWLQFVSSAFESSCYLDGVESLCNTLISRPKAPRTILFSGLARALEKLSDVTVDRSSCGEFLNNVLQSTTLVPFISAW